MQNPTARPLGLRITAWAGAALVAMLVLYIVNNWDRLNGDEFEAGDCVTVTTRLLDSDMDRAECGPGTADPLHPEDQVYRVESIVEGKDGQCPGSGRIAFSNESEDTTYCLVVVG